MRKTRDTGGYLPGEAALAALFRRTRSAALGFCLLSATGTLCAQVVRTGTTTVTATVAADASITVSTPTVLSAGAAFGAFTGSTTVTFSIRTTKVGGSGSITLQAAEFTTAGGPLVSAGNLTYSCSGTPSVGTKCAGPITASTSAPTAVLSAVGADAKANAQVVNVDWSLANSPAFSTGSYSSTVTFTLSSN
ncbi:MAG: hypothetical protein M3167_11015 [Acidobacteriota bacterium]|nr:hypothetical protein [Acidobacteriota bacterium]